MIRLVKEGEYRLIETKKHTKILTLDGKETFAWIIAGDIGEILVASHTPHIIDHILCVGAYRMYDVKDESTLTDLVHLELHAGIGIWQGYLLPTGLPAGSKIRNRIIPTKEIITKVMK
jgi:hypothetical protein